MNQRRAIVAFLRDDSGQALFEAVFFVPIVIFGIAAVIFFSQLGVLSERSELAVRYGNDVSYKDGNQLYSVASVYTLINEVENPGTNPLGALCVQNPAASASTGPTSTKIQQDIAAALVDAEEPASPAPASTPIAYASAKPYWQPAVGSVSVPGCQPNTIELTPASSTGEAPNSNGGLPVSTAGLSVSSDVNTPVILDDLLAVLSGNPQATGANTMPNLGTSAHMTFINVAAPNTILACLPGAQVAASALAPTLTPGQQSSLSAYCPSPL